MAVTCKETNNGNSLQHKKPTTTDFRRWLKWKAYCFLTALYCISVLLLFFNPVLQTASEQDRRKFNRVEGEFSSFFIGDLSSYKAMSGHESVKCQMAPYPYIAPYIWDAHLFLHDVLPRISLPPSTLHSLFPQVTRLLSDNESSGPTLSCWLIHEDV